MPKTGSKSKPKRKSMSDLMKEAAGSMSPEQEELARRADRVSRPLSPTPPVSSDTPAKTAQEATREQDSSDSASKPAETTSDSGTTREQRAFDSGTTREQQALDSGTTREQDPPDSGTTAPKPPPTREQKASTREQKPPTREQVAEDSGTKPADSVTSLSPDSFTREQTESKSGTDLKPKVDTREQLGNKKPPTREQLGNKKRATREQLGNKKAPTREQEKVVLFPSQEGQLGNKAKPDSGTKQDKPPASPVQMKLLRYLLSLQARDDSDKTPLLSREQIHNGTGISKESVKTQIVRLLKKGLLRRLTYSHSSNRGGSVYSVPEKVRQLVWDDSGTSVHGDSGTKAAGSDSGTPAMVSSSYLNITTTNNGEGDKALSEAFQALSQRIGLEDRGIGANDLLEVWRKGVFSERADLEASLEHLAFYLDTPAADSINHPKAWMLGQLRKGYYPEPAGFKTWEERQEEAKLEDARKRAERVGELRRKRFEAEFELWLAELPEEKKKQIAGGVSLGSHAARSILRAEYAKEVGFYLKESNSR